MNAELQAIAQAIRESRQAAHEQLQPEWASIAVLGIDMATERIMDTLDDEQAIDFRERSGWGVGRWQASEVDPS